MTLACPLYSGPKPDLMIPEEMNVVILWLEATPIRFASRLLWHVSECRWQCLLRLCWCCLGLSLGDTPGVCQLFLALDRQRRLRQQWHAAGFRGAQELCSGKFSLTWHPSLWERERSQTVHTREQRHAIHVSPTQIGNLLIRYFNAFTEGVTFLIIMTLSHICFRHEVRRCPQSWPVKLKLFFEASFLRWRSWVFWLSCTCVWSYGRAAGWWQLSCRIW